MYSERLKLLRQSRNLKQNEISQQLNIDRSQYGKYENEYVTMPIKHLNTLSCFYDASLDYIFGFSNAVNYGKSQENIDREKSGIRLKEFRKDNKLTQCKLANFLNTTISNISSYETATNLLATNYLYAICKKYHISADYLLGKVDSPKYLK